MDCRPAALLVSPPHEVWAIDSDGAAAGVTAEEEDRGAPVADDGVERPTGPGPRAALWMPLPDGRPDPVPVAVAGDGLVAVLGELGATAVGATRVGAALAADASTEPIRLAAVAAATITSLDPGERFNGIRLA